MAFGGRNFPEQFNPTKSKYSQLNTKKNLQTIQQRSDAPAYLQDDQKFVETTTQTYEEGNPVDLQRKIQAEVDKKDGRANARRSSPSASMLARLEHKKKLQSFDRFSKDFVDTHELEQWQKTMPQKEKAL